MKVKFGALIGLDGKEIKNNNGEIFFISKTIANTIAADFAKDNPMQRYELATKLFNAGDKEIDITESEKEIIKQICNSGSLSVLMAAQALYAIMNAK